jgi:hypothetical protein
MIASDRRQFAKLIAQHDPHVYPGRFVTCVHNPDRALCHNGNQTNPSLGDCQPLACRNVALTEHNLSAWGHQLSKVDSALQAGGAWRPMSTIGTGRRRRGSGVWSGGCATR